MRSESVTNTSAYGLDWAPLPAVLEQRSSGTSMVANVPESARRVRHFLASCRGDYGFAEQLRESAKFGERREQIPPIS